MYGLGTLINCAGILAGGLLGFLLGRFIHSNIQTALTKVCGISVLFIGIAGALEGMLEVVGNQVSSRNGLLVVCCLALGTLVGELLHIEEGFTRFGEWLKVQTRNTKDPKFVDAFVSTSLTICIGAMTIVGSIEDGISGDYTILATKAVLDLILVWVVTCAMGKGAVFSVIPVMLIQGSITLLASLLQPLMTQAALSNLSTVSSVLIFCVGANIIWDCKLRVANMLPAVIFAVAATLII